MIDDQPHYLMRAQERTLLAAERTFSAWIRTALAAMAGGLAILRLLHFKTEMHRVIAHVMGQTLIVWGAIVIIIASLDYLTIRKKLMVEHSYEISPVRFVVIVFPLVLVAALLIWVTLP